MFEPPLRQRAWAILKPLLIALVLALFAWLLAHKLRGLTWAGLRAALADIPPWRIALALVLTAVNYVVLVGYDYLAVRFLGHPMPLRRLVFGSFIGYAMSFNFGWIIGGSASRYRLYSSWGFSTLEIAKFITLLTITFWVGVFATAGVAFVAAPPAIPPEMLPEGIRRWLPLETAFPLGLAFLACIAGYLVVCGAWRAPIRWGRWYFRPPPLGLALVQTIVAALDQLVAASVFYVLLPASVRTQLSFFEVVNVYLLFTVVSALLHVPGGLAVLEKIVLDLIQTNDQAALAATLVVYRLVYYLTPLAIGGLLLLQHEWRLRERSLPAKPAPDLPGASGP